LTIVEFCYLLLTFISERVLNAIKVLGFFPWKVVFHKNMGEIFCDQLKVFPLFTFDIRGQKVSVL